MAPLLDIRGLRTVFSTAAGDLAVLDGIDLAVGRGEVVGLVGESGSGKTITGFSVTRLLPAAARVASGEVLFDGEDLLRMPPAAMRRIRGRRIAMIFQDPMMTLNPVLRIDTQMTDALRAHERISTRAARERCVAALREVGIAAPEERLHAYPHQLSGGMRQRVAIAIALLHGPDLVIADEPTTALDVTIQGQILSVVQRLCAERGTGLVWITHDLAVVAGLADRIAVMYAGRIVEEGSVDAVLDAPLHPYTRGLIDSVAASHPKGGRLPQIPGRMPALDALPQGCAFEPRCTRSTEACRQKPPMRELRPLQSARCFHPLGSQVPA